jgi:uncharacterized membrane protein YccC
MDSSASHRRRNLDKQVLRSAVVYGTALAISCLISYWFATQILTRIHSVSRADDLLGGMWAVVATIFVFRYTYDESVAAALSRMAATCVSFVLCFVYLSLFPFHSWAMVILIGVGAVVMLLIGRPGDVVTTGIATTVVMVTAALSPEDTWQLPILRFADTFIGIAIGVAAAWIGTRVLARAGVLPSESRGS